MILNLYSSILIPVVSEWLCPVEVCLLDTAVCNHSHREGFLSLLANCILSNSTGDLSSIFDWLDTRGAKINGFHLSSSLSPAAKRVLSQSKHLQWVIASPELLSSLLELCQSISSLAFSWGADENILPLLPRLRNLTSLDLGFCKDPFRINQAVAEFFPHLVSFSSYTESTAVIEGCKELTRVSCEYSDTNAKALSELSLVSLTLKIVSASEVSMMNLVDRNRGLHTLALRSGKFDDKLVCFAASKCPCLTQLHFETESTISDVGLRFIAAHCKALKGLTVSSNSITDAGVFSLVSSCPFIVTLWLIGDALTNVAVLTILRLCSRLNQLDIYSPLLTDVAFCRAFTVCPSLTNLTIAADDYDSTGKLTSKMFVSNAVDLEQIELSSGYIEMYKKHQISSSMCELRALVYFEFSDMVCLFMQSPRLIRVCLESVGHVNRAFFKELAKWCPLIEDVEVNVCYSFSSTCVAYVLQYCSNLKKLKLLLDEEDTEPEEEVQCELDGSVSPLTSLVVRDALTNKFLDAVSFICPSLERLTLTDCKEVTSTDVNNILQTCNLLSDIQLSGCILVDGTVLCSLMDLGRKWNCVDVSGCPLISKTDVMNFVATMNSLVVKLKV